MTKYLLLFALFFTGLSATPDQSCALHDFKMSVCEVIHAPETGNVALKVYLYTDDLTEALTGVATAPLPDRNAISNYILQHLELNVNGLRQPLEFFSLRQKDDQILVQFNTPANGIPSVVDIFIKNSLLVDKFKDQSNVVYAIVPDKAKQTQMLNGSKREAYFRP